ncbi:MAG: hypothetical protein Q7S45_00765 [Candidatus Curtissbacteria bacterium]|nr:hypothetical protein [Candidatus Curtissbacteria bacterium]
MSWIERSLEDQRRREEVQRQGAARSCEAQRNYEAEYRRKLGKDLARLVKQHTGAKIGAPETLYPGFEKLEGPIMPNNDRRTVYGKIQVDGVWFGIADTYGDLDWAGEPEHYKNLVVIGKDVRTGADAFRVIIDNNIDKRGVVGLGQALRELGYTSGR